MLHQDDTDRAARKTQEILGLNLDDDRSQRGPSVEDLPLKLTEERLLAESQRSRHVEAVDSVPLVPAGVVAGPHTPRPPSTQPRARSSAVLPNQPTRYGSVLNLSDGQGDELRTPAAPYPDERPRKGGDPTPGVRSPRASRVLWGAVIALTVALTAVTSYDYLAIRQRSVISSQLPGARVIGRLRAEAEGTQFELQEFKQSRFSAEVTAFVHKVRPGLAAASQRAQRLMGEVRGRYERWRAP